MSTTFVEISKSEHGHGGAGWEFGTCLWSPTVNRKGADRYSLMREPQRDDRVIHFYRDVYNQRLDTWLIGESKVSLPARVVTEAPPTPGAWGGMASYYRIELGDYRQFASPLTLSTLLEQYADEIRDDLSSGRYRFYPFTTHGAEIRTVQGIYLARCPLTLETIIQRAVLLEGATLAANDPTLTHVEFSEARRLVRERYFFARNPALVRAAKQHHGYTCQVCEFNFHATYGDLGEKFIEAHHLDPLSERPESQWTDELTTSVDRIAVLCSNCHRMVHRRRPAYSLDELRQHLAKCNATFQTSTNSMQM
jgi:hypothetical protein